MKASLFRRGINLWPPFLFAGIHVTAISADYRYVRVELRQRPWNVNYVRTHFGGSLFAMTDPFWMLCLLQNMGSRYFVWDKAGTIEFLKPGRGVVWTEFRLDDATLDEVKAATANGDKYLHWFENDVLDASGEVVARVRKQVYVRLKPEARGQV
ncbi:DUF4442 domain-containing protein [Stenotrophomonas sp. PS02298]|uniref:DUF4442 domain-containing protein n=1 Tax=Stenotrophomonas sp. PS02298 TaxID=2991424 RepID=UPI00249B3586|nr:DUF4442 domain-containing protein [Stenotrophomonas sp. PS02298]